MLVLSRREDERVCFPNLGIEVQVVKAGSRIVRLGVKAPREISVLRGELLETAEIGKQLSQAKSAGSAGSAGSTESAGTLPKLSVAAADRQFRHDVRDRLNTASLLLQVVQNRVEKGQTDQLGLLLGRALDSLQALDKDLATGSHSPNRRPQILIVEDGVNEGQLLAELLGNSGCETSVVVNGRQAIHHLRQHGEPDFVLLDMNMPELDGPATIRMIREQSEFDDLCLFGVSGLQREETGVPIGPNGVQKWYTKPVNAAQLAREIFTEFSKRFEASNLPASL